MDVGELVSFTSHADGFDIDAGKGADEFYGVAFAGAFVFRVLADLDITRGDGFTLIAIQ